MLRILRDLKLKNKKATTKGRDSKGRKIKEYKQASLETLEPDKNLPQGYLSVSQVTMYVRCAKQYEFRYIDRLIEPPAVPLTEGSCHHGALEYDNNNKFKTGEPLGASEVLDIFSDGFRDQSREIPKIQWRYSGETLDTVINRGRIFIASYMERFTRELIPSDKPEKRIEIELGGVPFLGFIDLSTKKSVIDYKVVGKAKSQIVADKDIQLTIYSLAENKKKVEFCCFCKTTVPKIVRVESERTERDYLIAEAIVESVAASIKKGAFPMCDPAINYLCNQKFCGYWHRCIGAY